MKLTRPLASALVASSFVVMGIPILNAGVIYIHRGDSGGIPVNISEQANDLTPLKNVRLSIDAPVFFSTTATSILGPLDVQSGTTQPFEIDFQISTGAPLGPFDVTIQALVDNADVDPPPALEAQIYTFKVIKNGTPPSVDLDPANSAGKFDGANWQLTLAADAHAAGGLDHVELWSAGASSPIASAQIAGRQAPQARVGLFGTGHY